MRESSRILMFVAVTVFSAAFSGAVIAKSTIIDSFDDVDSISLSTSSGEGILKKGTGRQVKVILEHTYADGRFVPVMEQVGGRLKIQEKFTGHSSSRGHAIWTLVIPDDTQVRFSTGSGDLQIDDLRIDLRSRSGSGNVTLNDVTGDVSISEGSGDVDIRGAKGELHITEGSGNIEVERFDGDLRATTGSGQVKIAESSGNFRVSAGSDSIRLNGVSGSMRVNVGSGDIDGRNLDITGTSMFSSGSGDAQVGLVSVLNHDISVTSGSGDAELDFGGNDISGEIVMRANRRNGSIRAPFSFQSEYEEDMGYQTTMVKETSLGDSDIRISVSTGSGTARIK